MDPRVIDYPAPLRWLVVKCFILPFRPKRSAAAYRSIWRPEGSPLRIYSLALQDKLRAACGEDVRLAMRYGQPSIRSAVEGLARDGIQDVLLVPLYPHYAMSSYETVVVEFFAQAAQLAPGLRTRVLQPFYDDPAYIEALHTSARPWLEKPFDHLLISFHGVPRRHLLKGDPSHAHCQKLPECCDQPSPVHALCYKAQTQRTAHLLAARAGIPRAKYTISYQSRLGREVWLEPYTDATLERLGREGVGRLLCITPAFVADCLETLEEIREEGRELFLHAGGKDFDHIPCLNDHPAWVDYLHGHVTRWMKGVAPDARAA